MEATQPQTEAIYQTRKGCRNCDSKTLITVLDLGVHYMPRFVPDKDETLPKAPLNLCQCAICGLLQLQHTVNPDLLYREFHYRSGINQTMRDALVDLAADSYNFYARVMSPSDGVWLDIGANDGFLLSHLPKPFHRVACEPALNFLPDLQEHADTVLLDYFTADSYESKMDRKADIITSAAMFYDLDDPSEFVRDITKVLSRGGVWVNQLNDSPTMLKQNAFDAVCHEHVCYWSVPQLDALYTKNGLTINGISYNEVNGGSVRIFASHTGTRRPFSMLGVPNVGPREAHTFALRTLRWKDMVKTLLNQPPFNREPIWGYGASTKGSTLLQYLDSSESFIAIADRNPRKHGLRMAGTWIPIADEVTMRRSEPKHLLVLPWTFEKEFVERETAYRESGGAMLFPLPDFRIVL